MVTVGVAMIVRNEEKDLPNCLEALRGAGIEMISIIDTGSTDGTHQVVEKFIKEGYNIRYKVDTSACEKIGGEWRICDFSRARNLAIEHLEQFVDYILILDADDILTNAFRLNDTLASTAVAHMIKVKHGKITINQLRLWRTRLGFKYTGKCHEYVKAPPNQLVSNSELLIVHKIDDYAGQEQGGTRNLRILEGEYIKGDRSPRTLFYYGTCLSDLGRYKDAIDIYNKYLAKPVLFHEERIFVYLYLLRAYKAIGEYGLAYATGFIALSEDQRFSEIYMEMAYMFYNHKHYFKSIGMCNMAFQDPPVCDLFVEKDKYKEEPERMINLCLEVIRG